MSDLASRLEAQACAALDATGCPGLAVGVVHEGRELLAGHGTTNVEHPLPVDPETLFQIASVTKPFTATALLRLADRGRVDPARPVRDYLPEFRLPVEEWTERVRVEDLLTHRGGWDGDRFFVRPPAEWSLAAVVAEFADNRQLFPPLTAWSYNNAGFSVAGRLIEVLTGSSFEDALHELVLAPLGLGHTFLRADRVVTHRVAAPHVAGPDGPVVLRGGGWQPGWELPPSDVPAGGIVSCARDLLRWARFHLGDGRAADGSRVLEAATLERMRTEVCAAGGNDDAMGVPWLMRDWDGVRFFGHTGQTVGYRSELWLQRERGFAFVALSNELGGHVTNQRVRDWVLRECLGVEVRPPVPLPAPPRDLAEYEGSYENPFWRQSIRAGDAGELVLEYAQHPPEPGRWTPPAGPPERLRFIGPDRVVAVAPESAAGERSEFGRDEQGRIAWFRAGSRIAPRIGA